MGGFCCLVVSDESEPDKPESDESSLASSLAVESSLVLVVVHVGELGSAAQVGSSDDETKEVLVTTVARSKARRKRGLVENFILSLSMSFVSTDGWIGSSEECVYVCAGFVFIFL